MCKQGVKIGRNTQVNTYAGTATGAPLLLGSPDAARIWARVSFEGSIATFTPADIIGVGYMDGGTFVTLDTISYQRPTVLLEAESCGTAILSQLAAWWYGTDSVPVRLVTGRLTIPLEEV